MPQTDEAVADAVAGLRESLDGARENYSSAKKLRASTSPQELGATPDELADRMLVFRVYFWTVGSPREDHRIVARDLRYALDKRFSEAGITIAFPPARCSPRQC